MTPTPSDAQPPEWIRVDREDGDHGFWTCAAATETSPKYIRADLFDAERQKREAAERVIVVLRAELGGPNADAAVADWLDLKASLAKANARIAEQDRHIERLTTEGLYISEQFSGAAGDIVKLRARIAELEKALRPFALSAPHIFGDDDTELNVGRPNSLVKLTAKAFRRARAALANIEKERDDEA